MDISNSQSVWVFEHSKSIYWTKIYKKLSKIFIVKSIRLNPLSFFRVLLGSNFLNNSIYRYYQKKRGYLNREYTEKKQKISKIDLDLFLISLLFSPYFIALSFFYWIKIIINLYKRKLLNNIGIKDIDLFNTVFLNKVRLTDCIFTQYLRSFISSGSISDFSIRTLLGMLFSSYIVISRFKSVYLLFKIYKYKPPNYFIINEIGYSCEAVRRLFILLGGKEIHRPIGYKKYKVFDQKIPSRDELIHPGVKAKKWFNYNIHFKDSLNAQIPKDFIDKFINRKENYWYLENQIKWIKENSLNDRFKNIIENEKNKFNKIFVFLHLHLISDCQFTCGYENYIDLCEWTDHCIKSLTQSNIVTFLKFHPNTFLCQKESALYYPTDSRFYNNLLKRYYISNKVKKEYVVKSKKFNNLYCLNPNLDSISLITYLRNNPEFKDIYFCSLTHHGTIALEMSMLGVPSYASRYINNLGFIDTCLTFEKAEELLDLIKSKKNINSIKSENAKKVIYLSQIWSKYDEYALTHLGKNTFKKDII